MRYYLQSGYYHFGMLPFLKKAAEKWGAEVLAVDGLFLASFTKEDYENYATREDALFSLRVAAEHDDMKDDIYDAIMGEAQDAYEESLEND